MKITVKGKQYDSGKMTRGKYSKYIKVRDELVNKDMYSDEDLDEVVSVLVKIFDNQFTEDDINDEFEIDEIILGFNTIDYEIATKVNNKVEKMNKAFTKGKK